MTMPREFTPYIALGITFALICILWFVAANVFLRVILWL
jgi:hypothetical protein